MSEWPPPEAGWYEQGPSAGDGWRKVSWIEESAWERDLGNVPEGRRLVRYAAVDGHLVAWSAWDANLALPNGHVIPPLTATIVG